ncbi:MAG: hypothetical protein RLZZ444_1805 [Pseudomonadota bacterium]
MDDSVRQDPDLERLRRRIGRMRGLAFLVLSVEKLIIAALPALAVLALAAIMAWFGFARELGTYARIATLIVLVAAFLVSLLPFRRFRWPNGNEINRRLESRSGVAHQAVAVQTERPASDDPFSMALWQLHRKRMAAEIGILSAGLPEPDLVRRDPYALRAPIVLLLVIAASFSLSNHGGRLEDLWSFTKPMNGEEPLRVDAWVTPPAYTALAPVYLKTVEVGATIRVPQGSELTIRMSGTDAGDRVTFKPASGNETIALAADKPVEPQSNSADRAASFRFKLVANGTINIDGLAYGFDLIEDRPPSIAFSKEPSRAVNGALEIAFEIKDDYGVGEASAEIAPVANDDKAIPLFDPPTFRLDLPGSDGKSIKSTVSRDLTEHPLSGKKVRLTLMAKDAAGHIGRSETKEIVLPQRFFSEPLAGSIAEQRQVFALDVNRIPHSLALADAISMRPEEQIPNLAHYLMLQSVTNRLKMVGNFQDLEEVAAYYWDVARFIEDGDLSSAEKRLKDAQDRLAKALDRNASDKEIAALMKELRDAMDQYMAELSKRMQNPDANRMTNQNMRMLRSQDIENMLSQLENLARSGNKDEARRLLSEMQRMMNNLQTARPRNNQQQQPSPMREQIDKLGELMQKQQKLMEETHKLEQALRDRMQRGDPLDEDGLAPGEDPFAQENPPVTEDPDQSEKQDQPGSEQDKMTADQLREALKELRGRQDQLSKDLQAFEKGLKDLGMKPGPGFGDAGKEMGESSQALGKAQGQRSADAQGRALEALRKGAGDMMQQMMQQAGRNGQQGMPMPGDMQAQGNDPLGRRSGEVGNDIDEQVKIPGQIDIQRAREILEQIRRKLGDGPASLIEQQYLERLLENFQ